MGPRYAAWEDYPKKKDAVGRWLCRWCGVALSGRRTSWCSKECQREVEVRCGHHVRRAVWLRDKGVCAQCGRDTNAIRRKLRALWKLSSRARWLAEIQGLSLTRSEAHRTLWQAHHVKSVEEGGGACGVEGYETLCLWCHKQENVKQAAKRRR